MFLIVLRKRIVSCFLSLWCVFRFRTFGTPHMSNPLHLRPSRGDLRPTEAKRFPSRLRVLGAGLARRRPAGMGEKKTLDPRALRPIRELRIWNFQDFDSSRVSSLRGGISRFLGVSHRDLDSEILSLRIPHLRILSLQIGRKAQSPKPKAQSPKPKA